MIKDITNKTKVFLLVVFALFIQFLFTGVPAVNAATSPDLGAAESFSVLAGAAVTCVGATTTSGAVGVSPGTSITGFPTPCTAGGGTHSNDAVAIAGQASTVSIFSALDQTCTNNYGSGQDLTLISPLVPGVYCSAGSFLLTGNLTLSGSGVWIFKTVSTLITSSGSSVTGGNPCDVWWRIGSAATLGSTTSFIGNIVVADVADTTAMNSGATLVGRILAQAAQTVTLNANTITSPSCAATTSSGSSGSSTTTPFCPVITDPAPIIVESRRIDADSIYIEWAQYTSSNLFNVQYGTTNGEWLYSVDVTGFSTTLNDLPANQPIWVRIAARNTCSAVGVYGLGTLVGGPGLPNAGIFTQSNWGYMVGALLAVSTLFILRKLRFSSRNESSH